MNKYLPDIFTSLNLLCGCLSVACVMQNETETACYIIFVAAVFDFLDGFLARSLDAYSPFGKQLDSLADMTSFGAAPGLIMYRYVDNIVAEIPPLAGSVLAYSMLLIPLFSAIRLARFNIDPKQEDTFYGLPTPANALLLASLPIIASDGSPSLLLNPWVVAPVTLLFAVLMVTPLKMVALKFKDYSWNNNRTKYLFIGVSLALILIFLFSAVPLIILFYILYSVSISGNTSPKNIP